MVENLPILGEVLDQYSVWYGVGVGAQGWGKTREEQGKAKLSHRGTKALDGAEELTSPIMLVKI